MDQSIKAGDFLDVDIELTLRSSKTDGKTLENIIRAVEALFDSLEIPVVLVELETKFTARSERKLLVLKRLYQSRD